MKLFGFELRILLKQKLYYLFLFSFFLLVFVTMEPFSLGKNFAPMDEEHILIHQVLEDSKKTTIENTYMKLESEKIAEELQKLELQLQSEPLSLSAQERQELEQKIAKLEKKNARLEAECVKVLSKKQQRRLQQQASVFGEAIGQGKYSIEELLAMDTAKFQQLPVSLNDKQVNLLLDEIDQILGGDTCYDTECSISGTNYREACIDIGAYNESLCIVNKKDGSFQQSSHKEMLKNYEKQLQEAGYVQLFAPFICDKVSFILCLSMIFLLMIFPIRNAGSYQELLYLRKISAFRYIGNIFAGLFLAAILPCIVVLAFFEVRLNVLAMDCGYATDFVTLPVSMAISLIPEILCLIGLNMLASLLLGSPLASIIVEVVLFLSFVDRHYGAYQVWYPLIRFNLKANYELFREYLPFILRNRIFVFGSSIVLFLICVAVYSMQKYGKFVKFNRWIAWLRTLARDVIKEEMHKRDKDMELRKEQQWGQYTSIPKYLFQLAYKKAIIICVLLDIAAVIFLMDMGGELLFCRILPLNGILFFSMVGLAEQTGDCRDLILLRNSSVLQWWKILLSSAFSLGFVWGIGTLLIWNSMEVRIFVSGIVLLLGAIYSILANTKLGVKGGIYGVAMTYIFMAITAL